MKEETFNSQRVAVGFIEPHACAGLTIGALTTMTEIERSAVIKETHTPLWDAACVMASPQVRTLATIGGNLVSAVPSADTAPPLMVLSAVAHITGPAGERTCPVEALFAGPSACSLAPDDILTHVTIPAPAGRGAYLKLMRRAGSTQRKNWKFRL